MPKSRFVAYVILGAAILIPFPATTIGQRPDIKKNHGNKSDSIQGKDGGKLPQRDENPRHGSLPAWFKDLDDGEDGQVALHQWRQSGKKLDEFRKYDLNNDGFITAEEILRYVKKPFELILKNGQANYQGTIEEEEDEETYRDKKSYKIFTIKLEKGTTYQIDHMSKAFDAYLYLEDADGELLAEDDDSGGGLNSRIVYRAVTPGTYRLIATCLGKSRTGVFSFSVRVISRFGSVLPKGLPPWFKSLDKDQDGQITLQEWREGGKKLGEFREYDLNDDGFITAEEVLRYLKNPFELKLINGHAKYNGIIEEAAEERYRGKKSFKIFTIKLERGITYQIDHISKVFQAFLHLEDSDGELLEEKSSPTIGGNSRLVFRANKAGTVRLIATSLGGFRTGAFLLSVRVENRFGGILPKGLPSWFQDLDTDGDGQVALYEWRAAGKNLDEFRKYDLNDDGYITAEEVLRVLKK